VVRHGLAGPEAASTLLADGGPDAVTLRAVGAAAGVSRTAPYRHFEDKDDLLSAVAADTLVFMAEEMRRGAADRTETGHTGTGHTGTGHTGTGHTGTGHTGTGPLYGACLGYVQAATERPAHYLLVFGDVPIGNPSQALLDAADGCVQLLYELITQAQRDGTMIAGDVRDIAALLWASLHGLVDLTLTGHLREPRMVDGAESTPRLLALALHNLAP
jgi:AcrR family transcriptional regulator